MKIQKNLFGMFTITILLLSAIPADAVLIANLESAPAQIAPARAIIPVAYVNIQNTGPDQILFGGLGAMRAGFIRDDNFGSPMLLNGDGTILIQPNMFDLWHNSWLPVFKTFAVGESARWTLAVSMSDDVLAYAGNVFGLAISGYSVDDKNGSQINIWGTNTAQTVNASLEIGDFKISNLSNLSDQNAQGGTPNQVLGGFDLIVSGGEPVSPPYLDVQVSTITGIATNIVNVYLYDQATGRAIAGPVSATSIIGNGGNVCGNLRFGNKFAPMIFGRGTTNHLLVAGKVLPIQNSGGENKIRLQIDTTKTIAEGLTYGYTFFPRQQQIVVSSVITVKEPVLAISISGNGDGNFVDGTFATVATITLDASQSSEDIRLSGLPLGYFAFGMNPNALSSCQLWDGNVRLVEGANTVNPQSIGYYYFALSQSLLVPKGTVKTLYLRCNIASGTMGWFFWNIDRDSGILRAVGTASANSAKILIGNWWTGMQSIGFGFAPGKG